MTDLGALCKARGFHNFWHGDDVCEDCGSTEPELGSDARYPVRSTPPQTRTNATAANGGR